MKIGICDDEKSTREYLEGLSKEWGQERGVPAARVKRRSAQYAGLPAEADLST